MQIKDLVDLENNLMICDGCKKRIGELDVPETQKDKEISELVEALEFCIGKEVFPQGVCECDKETEAYTKAISALNKHKTIKEEGETNERET